MHTEYRMAYSMFGPTVVMGENDGVPESVPAAEVAPLHGKVMKHLAGTNEYFLQTNGTHVFEQLATYLGGTDGPATSLTNVFHDLLSTKND